MVPDNNPENRDRIAIDSGKLPHWPMLGSIPDPRAIACADMGASVWPKITVVTPSFNQGRYVEATIRSVLLQEYPNLEYIVIDGGSTDNSVEIIKQYTTHLAYWVSEKDEGQAHAISKGFEMSMGDIMCWLNSDDIFLPGTLARVAQEFIRRPRVDFLYGDRLVIDEAGNEIGKHVWPSMLTRYHWADGQPLAQECSFWRRDLYEAVGGIDRSKFFIMDYDLFFRMWRIGRFRKLHETLGCIRQHDESKNSLHQQVRFEEMHVALRRFKLRKAGPLVRRLLNRIHWIDRIRKAVSSRTDRKR